MTYEAKQRLFNYLAEFGLILLDTDMKEIELILSDDKDKRIAELEREVKRLTPPPKWVTDAENYIHNCHMDIGFMGSPEYHETKQRLKEYWKNQNP